MDPVSDLAIAPHAEHIHLEPVQPRDLDSDNAHSGGSSLTRWGSSTTYQSNLKNARGKDEQNATEPSALTSDPIESGQFEPIGREFILQPQDGGFGAWSYVASAFAMYIVIWGLPQSLPVFQAMLQAGPKAEFPNSMAIGFLTPGIQDFQEGFLFNLLPRHAKYRTSIIITGIVIMTTALFLASNASKPWQVVLLHGHVFGIGAVMLNFVHVSVFTEWFDKRQTEAMGIIWNGYRYGSIVTPLLCNWLLEKYGYARTLRVLIAPMLTLLAPSIILLKGRYPAAHVVGESLPPRVGILHALRQPSVLFCMCASLLYKAASFAPVMFITAFGVDIGLTFSESVSTLAVRNAASAVGGHLVSQYAKGTTASDVALGMLALSTALVHALLWGFCKDKLGLILYAIMAGVCAGGTSRLLMDTIKAFPHVFYSADAELARGNSQLFTTVYSILSFTASLGTMSVGPLGMLILKHSPDIDIRLYGIGKYKYIVAIASSMCMGISALFFTRAVKRGELAFLVDTKLWRMIFGGNGTRHSRRHDDAGRAGSLQ